jgi:hypothetical protein
MFFLSLSFPYKYFVNFEKKTIDMKVMVRVQKFSFFRVRVQKNVDSQLSNRDGLIVDFVNGVVDEMVDVVLDGVIDVIDVVDCPNGAPIVR